MLKAALLPTVIVGIGCLALFSLFKGINGFYGALVAQFVVVVFFLVHLLVSKLSRNIDPMATMALALFSYVTKLTVIGSFLIILDKFTPEESIDRNSFGISAIALTAAWLGGEMDSPSRALEALMPEAVRNAMVARRWATEGVRDPKGREVMKDVTTSEMIKKGLGFTPTRLATAYEKGNSLKMLGDRARDNDNINFKLAKAAFEGDTERFEELMASVESNNADAPMEELQIPDEDSFENYLAAMQDSDAAAIMALPDKARPKGFEIQQRFDR
jgi:hypothetical protein